MHYFVYTSLLSSARSPLFNWNKLARSHFWFGPFQGLIWVTVYSWSLCMFITSKRCCFEWDSKSTLGGSLNLGIWIIIPINSVEMLLAISRVNQLMIFLHSEVIENDHIISHTGWDLKPLIETGFIRLLNHSGSVAS